jgi:hypothetical protein
MKAKNNLHCGWFAVIEHSAIKAMLKLGLRVVSAKGFGMACPL